MVSVSLPAGHLFDFDHDRAAAHNSEINICPHCFFTLIALILFLRTADCGLRSSVAIWVRVETIEVRLSFCVATRLYIVVACDCVT